jgi:hypothetical protein
MANDDFRIKVELDGESAGGLLDRLGFELGDDATELARELERHHLVVSRDGDELFVYAASPAAAEKARSIIQAELSDLDITAVTGPIEHWLDDEERWDDEAAGDTWEETEVEQGHAPWEVRVELPSHSAARDLADKLEQEGYPVERRWRYLIVGASTKEEAEALAERVHGEVEPGGNLIWETVPGNPFSIFGGMGSSGTPV